MRSRSMIAIFVIVFVDLLGFSLVIPLLPYYAGAYNATPLVTGLLVATYAAGQFIGAPLIGRLSDSRGRRPLLLISLLGTMAGFILLAVSDPVGRALAHLFSADPSAALTNVLIIVLLFVSRAIEGLTGGDIATAQAYISDITTPNTRAQGLGILGAAFGLGFVLGPAVGGILSVYGSYMPAAAAALMTGVAVLLTLFWLPESLSPERREELSRSPRAAFSLAELRRALRLPTVGTLLNIRFFFGMAFNMFTSVFALYAAARLHLTARDTGFILTYVGLMLVLVQGFAVGPLTRRFGEHRVITTTIFVLGFGLAAWAFVPNLFLLLLALPLLSIPGGVFNTVINSALSKAVLVDEIGGTLGLSASIEAFTRVLSPSLGGFLLESLGTWAPGIAGTVIMAGLAWFAMTRLASRRQPDPTGFPFEALPVPAEPDPADADPPEPERTSDADDYQCLEPAYQGTPCPA
ncbi:MAG: MFS transporter [Anaerolineae bacterium]